MYIKFTYWMDHETFNRIKTKLEEKNICLAGAKKAVCLPLSSKIDYGFVEPGAWAKFSLCRRQLSWYGSSKFAGKFLVVSNEPLLENGIELKPETIIKKIKFKPENLPGKDKKQIEELYHTKAFHEQCPREFLDISHTDSDLQDRWLKIMGIRGITYDELFKEQCANHANFIRPKYYLNSGDEIVPYSIGKTNRICSACLQFFNIIGADFPIKYVVPCPGATLFAGMSVNKYYEVQSGPDLCSDAQDH
ncbi:hypothetical protein [Desulfospira joergensenii]|uniref:hypothetical protein n=1 Tax=Desulfospira joergensenii TaxID=53329 RepID=UPI0003B6D2A7|nr:hypothetical protein [Desulfospira joergensenii]